MDTAQRPLRVLFRVAAGPRVGFGHLVRAVSLAHALGVPARLSVRGAHSSITRTARRLGGSPVAGGAPTRILARTRPDVLVVDDRVARETAAWRRAARRHHILIVGIHDLGIGLGDADLLVDGSIGACRGLGDVPALLGTRYAVLNPRTAGRGTARAGEVRHAILREGASPAADVVIALGGGPRRALAVAVARALVARRLGARVGIAGGFVNRGPDHDHGPAVRWVKPQDLGAALAGARVAVVGGGVTLYECLALGVPCVAAAVVPSQRPTVAAFAKRGAVVDGGSAWNRMTIDRLAGCVADLLQDPARCETLRRTGRQLVDGRGAIRVAAAIRRLAAHAAGKAGQR